MRWSSGVDDFFFRVGVLVGEMSCFWILGWDCYLGGGVWGLGLALALALRLDLGMGFEQWWGYGGDCFGLFWVVWVFGVGDLCYLENPKPSTRVRMSEWGFAKEGC